MVNGRNACITLNVTHSARVVAPLDDPMHEACNLLRGNSVFSTQYFVVSLHNR